MSAPEGLAAFAAAAMMAVSPITGDCQARTLSLCTGDRVVHTLVVWDQDGSTQPRSPTPSNKGCHACVLDKRKSKANEEGEDGV